MFTNLIDSYKTARLRLLLLDYDGTLVNFAPTPEAAVPTAHLRACLKALTSDPNNTVVVISGRGRATLEDWLGDLDIGFVAEHGSFMRESGGDWTVNIPLDPAWKQPVRQLIEEARQVVPGTGLEEKEAGLVWHWRELPNFKAAQDYAPVLVHKLKALPPIAPLDIMPGSGVVEVRLSGWTKGRAASAWLAKKDWEFILCAGDDLTDETMFAVMPPQAHVVKVGKGRSLANQRVASPEAMLRLLDALTKPIR